jgi:type I restriction enzyme S subunit
MDSDEVLTDEIAQIAPRMADKLARHKVKAGDILLPRRGELDRRAYVHPEQEGWICGTGSIRIRVQDKSISRAVFHALSARHTVSWLERFAVGTTMPNLNTTIISNIPVHLPKKRDAIKTAVNQLEQILETQKAVEQKIAVTQKLKRAILQEMLS